MIANMFSALFGCRHKRTTRPITPVHRPGDRPAGTYIACLECGKQFHYDTTNMRVGAAMPLPPASYRPVCGKFQVQ
jgi:hypothetical protein